MADSESSRTAEGETVVRWRDPREGRAGLPTLDGILISTLPPTLAAIENDARTRGVRLAGLFVEADGAGMTALAELAITGQLTPTIAATYPLDQAGTAQSTKSGPGKTVLALV